MVVGDDDTRRIDDKARAERDPLDPVRLRAAVKVPLGTAVIFVVVALLLPALLLVEEPAQHVVER